jgi:hypothetical protein
LTTFVPRLEILPEIQRQLWPKLANLASQGFVLYGGTAVALRCGHRVSVDFDFFSAYPLDRASLHRALPWIAHSRVLQDQPETFTLLSPVPDRDAIGVGESRMVKLSFFGGLSIGRMADPQFSSDGVALVASPLDLLATKLKVLLQRAERKDYEDVAVLLASGLSLEEGLAAARALYGSTFPISEALKALVYFADGDLAELSQAVRKRLERAVLSVDAIPELVRMDTDLAISTTRSGSG